MTRVLTTSSASRDTAGRDRMPACSLFGRILLLLLLLGLRAWTACADEPRVIPLWPEGVPDARPNGGEERVEDGRVYNVHMPTLTVFPAPAAATAGTAVIICPGGAYLRLSVAREGDALVERFNAFGVTACVRPDRIGVFGSSAGGHLAACAGTLFAAPEGRAGGPLDAVSARPDFLVLLYPVITMTAPFTHAGSRRNLLGDAPSAALVERLSVETQVTKGTPPTFLVHTGEDASVPLENSLLFFQALRRAGIPAEMHLYEKGHHGFGVRPGLGSTSEWPKRLEEWLRAHGWLERAPR
jgi:acetyl esterase/lipase